MGLGHTSPVFKELIFEPLLNSESLGAKYRVLGHR